MKKLAVLIFAMCLNYSGIAQEIYKFKVESLSGGIIDFASFRGKKVLIVNTASKCGYTYQYESLQKLAEKHAGDLVVVGFPSDNFGGQEFDDNKEIKQFCDKNFGVTFPLAVKANVVGKDAHPLFKYLTRKSENGVMDAEIKWNFYKFLIDENGNLVNYFGSKIKPEDIPL